MLPILSHLLFQSTPSVWRETLVDIVRRLCYNNFNPLPPYGGRLQPRRWVGEREFISIHSLRMEGDFVFIFSLLQFNISIHSLRMEGDATLTHPRTRHGLYFNPLPPYGGRLQQTALTTHGKTISIHSLRMEGDQIAHSVEYRRYSFQSTPSVWRETLSLVLLIVQLVFQSTPSVWRET